MSVATRLGPNLFSIKRPGQLIRQCLGPFFFHAALKLIAVLHVSHSQPATSTAIILGQMHCDSVLQERGCCQSHHLSTTPIKTTNVPPPSLAKFRFRWTDSSRRQQQTAAGENFHTLSLGWQTRVQRTRVHHIPDPDLNTTDLSETDYSE